MIGVLVGWLRGRFHSGGVLPPGPGPTSLFGAKVFGKRLFGKRLFP
jgi:hypothetical protein